MNRKDDANSRPSPSANDDEMNTTNNENTELDNRDLLSLGQQEDDEQM